MKLTTKELIRISIAVSLIAVGAQIKIPSPLSGYFTLQFPLIVMVSTILGSKKSFIATTTYLIGGLIGIPWFASGGGIAYLSMPTFGFLLAFLLVALLVGLNSKIERLSYALFISCLATILVWLIGILYMTAFNKFYFGKVVSYIAAIGSIFSLDLLMDLILACFATSAAMKIRKRVGV